MATRWGALDVLFNNAAIMENFGDPRTFEDEAAHALEPPCNPTFSRRFA